MSYANRKTQPKYRRIQATILADIRERRLRPGDRIASERALCKTHGASLGTVQKALDQLAADGVIDRRHGSGTYVQAGDRAVKRPAVGAFHGRRKSIRLRVDTARPRHMAFWRASAERFAARLPFVGVEVVAHMDAPPAGDAFDMVECGQMIPTVQEAGSLIDLHTFSGGAIRCLGAMPTPCLAPVHMGVSCMLYNRTLLERLGCPIPSATDYRSQFEHLRSTLARARAVLGDQPVTACNLGPVITLGGHADRLIGLMRAKRPAADLASLETPVAQVMAYKELMLHGRHPADHNDADVFDSGRSPLFPASNVHIVMLQGIHPEFEWGSHPFFSVDDTIPCSYIGIGIDRSTPNPLECVRFIEHLQSPAEQAQMAQAGLVPIHPVDLGAMLLPPEQYPPRARQQFVKHLRPNRLAGKINHYLLDAAIEAELYQATSPKAFLKRAINLGKDYLRFTAPEAVNVSAGDTAAPHRQP